jgi:putative membrane protein
VTGHRHGDADLVLLVAVLLALGYEWLSIRVSRPARPWPAWRGASFLAGCAVLVLAAGITPGSFAGHMTRHLLIGMVAPLGLILGAPITLLLRFLPAPHARTVVRALRTPAVRLITHPVTALCLTVGTLAALYCTPLYARAGADPAVHQAVDLHFLLSGWLFAWAVAAPDPVPDRPSVRTRLIVLGAAVAAHATLSQLLYAGAYVHIPASAADRQTGATIMYYGGDLTELLLAGALTATWRPRRRPAPGRTSVGQHRQPLQAAHQQAGTPTRLLVDRQP